MESPWCILHLWLLIKDATVELIGDIFINLLVKDATVQLIGGIFTVKIEIASRSEGNAVVRFATELRL